MSFKAYAFIEHARKIEENPMEQVVVAIGYTENDLIALAGMTSDELTKHPLHNFDGTKIDEEAAKKMLPYGDKISKNATIDAITAGPEIGLISMFATLGYASAQGRDIDILYGEPLNSNELNPKARDIGTIIKGSFAPFENNVLEGAQSFFGGTHERVGSPSRMMMYAILKPLALH